jgi:hypothetical protein
MIVAASTPATSNNLAFCSLAIHALHLAHSHLTWHRRKNNFAVSLDDHHAERDEYMKLPKLFFPRSLAVGAIRPYRHQRILG